MITPAYGFHQITYELHYHSIKADNFLFVEMLVRFTYINYVHKGTVYWYNIVKVINWNINYLHKDYSSVHFKTILTCTVYLLAQ